MTPPPLDAYQIGWICALPTEVAAAKQILDENFGILDEQDSTDTNLYTLGRVGRHYVVIAGLPGGQYGTTSATTVAINMMRTFSQSLRVGLMVGIGGGIPSTNHDVRLGDIVVSYPEGSCGGVLQYDMGKVVGDGQLQRTGSLNSPPRSLLNAVANMTATALTDCPNYRDYIEKAIRRNAHTKQNFGRPDAATDRLFKVEHEHPTSAATCEACLSEWEEPRHTREEAGPQVHYGIIASGNAVMKCGATRERLRQETGALCFEMEAAGLMMDFPCIVVRGICDYADSHKNKQWQGYAALAAASYAKDLLSYVPVAQISQEKSISVTPKRSSQQVELWIRKLIENRHLLIGGRLGLDSRLVTSLLEVLNSINHQATTSAALLNTDQHFPASQLISTVPSEQMSNLSLLSADESFRYSVSMRDQRRCRPTASPEPFWLAPKFNRWKNEAYSSLLVIKSSFRQRFAVKDFCVNAIEILRDSGLPVLWALKVVAPESPMASDVSTVEILKSLVSQAMQVPVAIWTESSMAAISAQIDRADTENDWLHVLGRVLTRIREVIIIVDVELLNPALDAVTEDLPMHRAFLTLFRELAEHNSSTMVKIILVTYRSFTFSTPTRPSNRSLVLAVGKGGKHTTTVIRNIRASDRRTILCRRKENKMSLRQALTQRH